MCIKYSRILIDLCSTDTNCSPNAHCKMDEGEKRKKCSCDLGFEGDGISRCSRKSTLPGNKSITDFENINYFDFHPFLNMTGSC